MLNYDIMSRRGGLKDAKRWQRYPFLAFNFHVFRPSILTRNVWFETGFICYFVTIHTSDVVFWVGGILTKDTLNGGELGYPQQMMMSIMNSLLDSFRQHWSENWPIQGNQLRGEGILQWPVSPNLLPNSSAGWKKLNSNTLISRKERCVIFEIHQT